MIAYSSQGTNLEDVFAGVVRQVEHQVAETTAAVLKSVASSRKSLGSALISANLRTQQLLALARVLLNPAGFVVLHAQVADLKILVE